MDSNAPPKNLFPQQHIEFILDAVNAGFWHWDINSNVVQWSDGVNKIFGLEPGSFEGTYDAYLNLIYKDDRDRLLTAVENALNSEGSYQIEHRVVLPNGGLRWLSGQGQVSRDSSGKPSSLAGIVFDITNQKLTEQKLTQSEERFRAFSEASNEAIAFTHQGYVVDTNKTLQKLLGYTVTELQGKSVGDFVAPEDIELVAANIKSGSARPYEHRALRKDGSVIYVEAYGKNVEHQGKPCRMTSLRDISARKQAEDALQKNQLLTNNIIDNSPAIIFLKDFDGRYMLINRKFKEMFDVSESNIIGKTGEGVIDPLLFPILKESDEHVFNSRLPYEIEINLQDNTGNTRTFNTTKFPLFDSNDNIYGIGGISTDITERILAENHLHERDQMIRGIVETSKEWFWSTDLNGNHAYSNPAIFSILGYRPEEIAGKSAFSLMHQDDLARAQAAFTEASTNLVGWKNLLIRWRHKNGSYRYMESNCVVITDENGHLCGLRGTDRDVTDRIRMDEEKEKLETQLRQSQKMEAVGQLAGGVAHDFNNILTVILGHTELAELTLGKQAPNKELLQTSLDEIRQSAQQAATLTSQLLAFSRRQVSKPQTLYIDQTVVEMESMLKRLITENIRLTLTSDQPLNSVCVDPNQLQQVVMNLVINARDAMPNGGSISVETNNIELDESFTEAHSGSHKGSNVRLSVSDTGFGMDNETVQRIFEPFYSTKPVGQGTGLGLSMVYGIIKQANGYIRVESEPGKGTAVMIYFPVCGTSEGEINPNHDKKTECIGGNETILVCEDDEMVRKLTIGILEGAGYNALGADHGEQALAIAYENREEIMLLLTDLIMPGMNGQKLAAATLGIIPNIKTLYSSGYTANTISKHGILAEDIEFLQKPFTRNDLLQQVRRILDS